MERRGWGGGTLRYGRYRFTGWIAAGIVIATLIVGWFIDQRGASAADRRLAELARQGDVDPVETVARAARANRLVFLSDIHGSVQVKQFAARVITRVASTSGLDAVILEIGADLQPYVDQYFDRQVEDAAVLLSHPRTTGDPAAARAYLDIYRTIWSINRKLGADQRIRVVAADLPGWPPAGALSPSHAAQRMAERETHMKREIDAVIGAIPGARILVFADGMHVLRGGTIVLQSRGTAPVTVTPVAAQIAASTEETFTVLVDAPSARPSARDIAPYSGTRVAGVLDEQGIRGPFGVNVTADFDHVRQPVIEKQTPGIEFDLTPRDYRLRNVANAYVNLGR